MGQVKVAAFSISIDGFGAGIDQDAENPLGRGGLALHDWMSGRPSPSGSSSTPCAINERFAARATRNVGAWIMGRNMFAPSRGAWSDPSWRGWWGEEPSFRVPVFVLTHHARSSIKMSDGTVFHFVTEGLEAALHRARKAAGDCDVRIGGGVGTVRQYLVAGCVDEVHLATVPVLMGAGETLFPSIDLLASGFTVAEQAYGRNASHSVLVKKRH